MMYYHSKIAVVLFPPEKNSIQNTSKIISKSVDNISHPLVDHISSIGLSRQNSFIGWSCSARSLLLGSLSRSIRFRCLSLFEKLGKKHNIIHNHILQTSLLIRTNALLCYSVHESIEKQPIWHLILKAHICMRRMPSKTIKSTMLMYEECCLFLS